jgi:hypothetical protein
MTGYNNSLETSASKLTTDKIRTVLVIIRMPLMYAFDINLDTNSNV